MSSSLKKIFLILCALASCLSAYAQEFNMKFKLIYSDKDPEMSLNYLSECRYFTPVWKVDDLPQDKVFHPRGSSRQEGGDGIDDSIKRNKKADITADYFYSGRRLDFEMVQSRSVKDTLIYDLSAPGYGCLTVKSYGESGQKTLDYVFTAERDGYFSVLYAGAPEFALEQADEVWQPMVWQQKRFPAQSYLTLAFQCPLPSTLVSSKGKTYGVIADPEMLPFMPLPSREQNNRFGVLLRNMNGNVQPMIAAPVPGGEGSYMKKDECFPMKIHLVINDEDIPSTFERLSRELYGFRDFRSNAIASTNTVIDNMVQYTLSPYSNFIDSLKGCSYSTDVPGSTKNVSSLHPLSISLVKDDAELFEKRAVPILEYMLSRDNSLFCLDTTQKVQNPSRKLGAPCAPASELITLYELTGGNSEFLKDWAEKKYRKQWYEAFSMYESTGDQSYFDRAQKGALTYVKTKSDVMQTGLKSEFFWSAYVAKYIHLLEMYELTGERLYLDAAHKAARYYAMFTWMCPLVPEEEVTVNKGGKAPWYWYLKSRGIPQQSVPEESVEAWRLSEIGLTPESSTTGMGHRAVFMAHHAPYFLSIAHYTGDDFLRDIARSAVVGRYRNFPGYHINTDRTTAYEKVDFPFRKHEEISVNSFHYNHPFPHISILIDYLVTDAFDKSGERIAFPSRHIEGYGYLQNRFYGMEAGRFYSEKNVWLWLPSGLVEIDDVELNYLSGRSENSLCLAFMNQSDKEVKSDFVIDTDLVPDLKGHSVTAQVWSKDRKEGKMVIKDGKGCVTVPAKGITSLVIGKCSVKSDFQDRFVDKGSKWQNCFYENELGDMTAALLDMGRDLKHIYVFLREDDSIWSKAVLRVSENGGEWTALEDDSYPYEFSIPADDSTSYSMQIVLTDRNDVVTEGDVFTFNYRN